MRNILLAGVGGQGTVLASKLIARCAISRGEMARTAETIGMAQRGGSVVSHVRIGDDIASPLIPQGCADVLIGFEPAEAVRSIQYLKKSGVAIISTAPIKPVTDSLSVHAYSGEEMIEYLRKLDLRLILADTEIIAEQCGTAKVLNVALLGAAASSGALGVSLEELKSTIQASLPPKFHEMNIRALYMGADAAR